MVVRDSVPLNVRCRLTNVAPRDRGGQGADGPTGGVFAAARRPLRAPLRMPGACARIWEQGFRVAGSVPRRCEDSTDVRWNQGRRRNRGTRAEWWGEVAQTWGRAGSRVGAGWGRVGNGWRGRVTLFGVRGSGRAGGGRTELIEGLHGPVRRNSREWHGLYS